VGTVLDSRERTGRSEGCLNTRRIKTTTTNSWLSGEHLHWALRVLEKLICRDRYTWIPVSSQINNSVQKVIFTATQDESCLFGEFFFSL